MTDAAKVKVKMLVSISGLANPAADLPEHSFVPDQIVELNAGLAAAWLAGGLAAPLDKVSAKAAKDAADKAAEEKAIADKKAADEKAATDKAQADDEALAAAGKELTSEPKPAGPSASAPLAPLAPSAPPAGKGKK